MKTPAPFEQRRLKYVASINQEALTEETPADFLLQYIDIGNVDSGGSINEIAFYQFGNAPSRARRIVRDGDVIISTVRTYLQAIAPIENPPANLIVSTGFAVVRPQTKIFHPGFCKYALREPEFLAEIERRSVGVSYPAVNASDVADIFVPTPGMTEQRAIADYLDRETARIDALVAAKERVQGLLTEKRRALITRAVTQGLNPDTPMRDSGVPWLGEVPAHWQVQRLKFSLSKIEQGWSPQCYSYPAEEGEWGVLKVGAVNGWIFDVNENKRLPDDLNVPEEYEIKRGDILMSRANTTQLVGSVALVRSDRRKLLLCDKLYRLIIQSKTLLPEYLVYFFRSVPGRFEFERDASGSSSSMQNIGQDSVANAWIPLPPREEQRAIVTYIESETQKLDALQKMTKRTVGLLKERRAALIAAAVTGQLVIGGQA